MIISRTPFRISFFGGGTDYPVWYRDNQGMVISTTINKYCFITLRCLPPFFEYRNRIRYYYTEETNNLNEIQHPSVRECLKHLDITRGVEIVHTADLPARSGLGTSSTFTVGLLHSLYTLKNRMPTKRELALNAIEIEQNKIKEHVGSQDQTAAAFGGFNVIHFGGVEEVHVEPLPISPSRMSEFQSKLILFFTGFSRDAAEIAGEKVKNINAREAELRDMLGLVKEVKYVLINESKDLDVVGTYLNEQWKIKKSMADQVSNPALDSIYDIGIKNGAIGGKLLGAGGGGFMLFYVPVETQNRLKDALRDLLHVPFRFDALGSQIIYYSHDDS